MNKRFTNTRPTSLKDLTSLEAKGWVIERLNEIETKMDIIITNHFQPKDKNNFRLIMLNSTIIGFVPKVKILRGLEIIDETEFDDITEMSRIRNGFAHQPTCESLTIAVSDYDEESKVIEATDKMGVMNSRGFVKEKDVRDWLILFYDINKKISLRLIELIKS